MPSAVLIRIPAVDEYELPLELLLRHIPQQLRQCLEGDGAERPVGNLGPVHRAQGVVLQCLRGVVAVVEGRGGDGLQGAGGLDSVE